MRTDLFDFDLPTDRIALRPASPRDAARLLVVRPGGAPDLEDRGVGDLPDLLRPGDCLVVNDSKVIAARLNGRRIGRGSTEPSIGNPAQAVGRLALARLHSRGEESAGRRHSAVRHRGARLFPRRARCSSFAKR